ncbi:MAG: YceI family protein, partial [Saprospiraceae bacterium]
MKNLSLLAALFLLLAGPLAAQRFFTRDAKVYFDATSPLEKIEATTKSGTCVLDTKTGKMEWKVLIKGFQMEKALMQEHFNENYLESSKFPNAQFKGSIINLSEVNFTQDGKYAAKVKGQLTIHGVTKEVDVTGMVKVNGGAITIASAFQILAADYGISIPALVRDKIAKEIKVSVEALLQPM